MSLMSVQSTHVYTAHPHHPPNFYTTIFTRTPWQQMPRLAVSNVLTWTPGRTNPFIGSRYCTCGFFLLNTGRAHCGILLGFWPKQRCLVALSSHVSFTTLQFECDVTPNSSHCCVDGNKTRDISSTIIYSKLFIDKSGYS